MKRALLLVLVLASSGCASTDPGPGWLGGVAALLPARPSSDCRYMTVLIQHSNNGTGMSERDTALAERVADLMEQEFARRGTRVVENGDDAYFSLLVLAAEEPVHDGFVFSAVLAARARKETHDSGFDTYAAPAAARDEGGEALDGESSGSSEPSKKVGTATLYHGMSWGEQSRLRRSVRDYVRQADVALLPLAHDLCEFDRRDQEREDELDAQLAEHGAPL